MIGLAAAAAETDSRLARQFSRWPICDALVTLAGSRAVVLLSLSLLSARNFFTFVGASFAGSYEFSRMGL